MKTYLRRLRYLFLPLLLLTACNQNTYQEHATAPPPPPPPPPPMLLEESLQYEAEPTDQTAPEPTDPVEPVVDWNTEDYDEIVENPFQRALQNPLSTFSIDVDRASYANTRRFLRDKQLPPAGAVRLEEFINYFDYDYPQPMDGTPFSVQTEMTDCPWAPQHKLLRVGLQGMKIPREQVPASNLVFLLDVSGSMDSPNKLPLLKRAFQLLTQQLRPTDRVAMVVYAGASGVVLPSTPGDQQKKILDALDRLSAGGSTAGADGIKRAYQIAREHFIPEGNNRVILATDGDFNVGASSDAALVKMIEKERADGIFLSILGFGTGNYKDNKMEKLADHGNGNYAYIDNIQEARKVLVKEFSGTLFAIAKDVKIQIEFNPAHVQAYRLLGYENRMLRDEDFNDDTVDAGEIGAGHTVTALYELIPTGVESTLLQTDALEYQEQKIKAEAKQNPDWLTLKLRYKLPKSDQSELLRYTVREQGLTFDQASADTRFAAAVAGFGMLLRESAYKGETSYASIKAIAQKAKGDDPEGYRSEFLQLVDLAETIADDRRE